MINFQRKAIVKNCRFLRNTANVGNAICNDDVMEIDNCKFFNNDKNESDVIVNNSNLKLFNSHFEENISRSVICNVNHASLVVDYCEFIGNIQEHSVIYNSGEKCNVNTPTFDNECFNIQTWICTLRNLKKVGSCQL